MAEDRDGEVLSLEQIFTADCDVARRRFCVGVSAGAGLIALGGGCGAGAERVTIGGLDDPQKAHPAGTPPGGPAGGGGGSGGSGSQDAGATRPGDMAQGTGNGSGDMAQGPGNGSGDMAQGPSPDMAQGPACSGMFNAGPATAITMNTGKMFQSQRLIVCRDQGGLFAMSNICTHAGCPVQSSNPGWFCNCHGARFDFDGGNPTQPARSPLKHYSLCVDASGTIFVNPNVTVPSSDRA